MILSFFDFMNNAYYNPLFFPSATPGPALPHFSQKIKLRIPALC